MARDERNQHRMEKVYGELVEWLDVLEYRVDLIDMTQDLGPNDHPHFDLRSAVDGQIEGERRPGGSSRMYWSVPAAEAEQQLTHGVDKLKKIAKQRWNELDNGQSEQTSIASQLKEQIEICKDLYERASIQLRKDLKVYEN